MIRRNRIYIETALNGPPISLDGINGVVPRLQAINRWITKYYPDNTGVDMETFDLSECYSKLDQKEIIRVLTRMISSAFAGRRFLAVNPCINTNR